MGAVVESIGHAFESVGHAVEQVGSFVGHAVEGVAKSIGSNPLKFVATVAAVATGNAWAIPIINGVDALAHGATIGSALMTTAASYAGSWVAGGLDIGGAIGGGALGAAADNVVRNVVTAGLTGGNIGSAALSGAISGGIGGALQGTDLVTQLGVPSAVSGIIGNTLGGAASAAAQGKDAAAGASSGLMGGLFNWASNGIDNTLNNLQSSLSTSSNDPGAQEVQAQIDQFKDTTSGYSDLAKQFDTTNKESQDLAAQYNDVGTRYNEALKPSVDAYTAAQGTYNDAVNTYQGKVNEFNDLKAQYDDAVASGNTDLANTLAGQANAKIAEANDAYSAYQTQQTALDKAYADYTSAKDSNGSLFDQASTLKEQYEAAQTKLQDLDTQGKAAQAAFQEQQKAVEEKYNAYVDQSAKAAFAGLGNENVNGLQKFDDGSSIQTFDDGSRIVTNSDGTTTTYDSEGNVYDAQGNATEDKSPDSTAKNYSAALKGLFAGSGKQSSAITRSNAAAGKPAAGGSSQVDPTTGLPIAGAIGAAGAVSNLIGGDKSDTTPVFGGGHDTNYDVMSPISKIQQQGAQNMYNIPGVTDLINPGGGQGGYTQASQQNAPGQQQTAQKNIPINTADIYDEELAAAPQDDSIYASGGQVSNFFAQGGMPHSPVFFSEGGANYVQTGSGTHGTEDGVDAKLAEGEFVIPADVVAALGNGSNEAGAGALQQMVQEIRTQKHSNSPDQLPPDAKSPLEYLQQAQPEGQ